MSANSVRYAMQCAEADEFREALDAWRFATGSERVRARRYAQQVVSAERRRLRENRAALLAAAELAKAKRIAELFVPLLAAE